VSVIHLGNAESVEGANVATHTDGIDMNKTYIENVTDITLQQRGEFQFVNAEAPDGLQERVGDSKRMPYSTAPYPDYLNPKPTPETKTLFIKVASLDESVLQPLRDHIDRVWHPKAMRAAAH